MEDLPDIEALARADEEQLLKLWQGLGYYNRVRNLQTAARQIVDEHDGVFPSEPGKIRTLKGIGDYTAGAVASIAFDQRTPAVDGNVLRVMSRINADCSDIKAASTKKKLTAQLAELYPEEGSGLCGDFTQGLIELGATVCVPNGRPQCEFCPVAEFCRAKAEGIQLELPVKAEKKARRIEERTVFILTYGDFEEERSGKIAVRKRPDGGLLANLAEFPNLLENMTADQALQRADEWGCKPTGLTRSAKFKHIFSHVEWHMTGYYITCARCSSPNEGEPFRWVSAEELETEVPLPSAFRYFL
jgi:A/G-specific adenine glycosylase